MTLELLIVVIFFFVTLVDLPTITTNSITEKSASSAVCGGVITSDGGGYIFERGVCWNIIDNPTITDSKTDDGTGTDNFTSAITGLTPFTKYYVRAYAKNNAGTGYGSVNSFTTLGDITFNPSLTYGTVTDIDGNVYNTIVTIGTQTWMAENLKTTHYSDGTAIPLVTGNSNWDTLDYTSKAYCWYDDDSNQCQYLRCLIYMVCRYERCRQQFIQVQAVYKVCALQAGIYQVMTSGQH